MYKQIGTVHKNPAMNAKRIANLRVVIAGGLRKARKPEELEATAKKMAQARARMSDEDRAKQYRKISDKAKGRAANGRGAKGRKNWKAAFWIFRAPDGAKVSGVNLCEIIEANSHRFLEADLKPRTTNRACTRAYEGLRSLFKTRNAPLSWKGWTPIAQCAADDLESRAAFLRERKVL